MARRVLVFYVYQRKCSRAPANVSIITCTFINMITLIFDADSFLAQIYLFELAILPCGAYLTLKKQTETEKKY